MNSFSKRSQKHLETCHPSLQRLAKEVLEHVDCAVLEGYRGRFKQEEYYMQGLTKVHYPMGRHNSEPSLAIHLVPYPIPDWENDSDFYYFAGFVKGIAVKMGIDLIYGGDWDGDGQTKDQRFNDLIHFEMEKPEQPLNT